MKKRAKKYRAVKPVPKSKKSFWMKEIDSLSGTVIILACFFAAFMMIRYVTALSDMLIKSQVLYY